MSLANISLRQKILVMVGVALALLLAALDQTIVATAIPKIVQDLNGLEHLSWVITAYLLASTVIVPIYGKLSDIYGRKYFIIVAVVVFLIGSALSGLSQNMIQLILFRGLQGLGGGAIFANAFTVIGDLFPPAERGKWQGIFGGVFGLASVVGPLLGGFITDNFTWRWVFYINIPIGILALIFIFFLMPHFQPDRQNRSIDFSGAAFLTTSLVTLLLGLVWGGSQFPWLSVQIIGLFAAAIISLLIFIFVESRAKEPILPLDLFRNRIFSVSSLAIFFVGIGMFGSIIYVPLFAQLVLGVTATNSGTILTPMMLSFVFASISVGQITARTGRYKWFGVFGMAVATVGIFLLSRMTPSSSQAMLVINMVITGIGVGSTMPIFSLAVQNAFEHSKLGVVTASTQLFRSIGGTVGTAVLGSMLNSNLSSKIPQLAATPFAQAAKQFDPRFDVSKMDANTLQAILTGPARAQIEAKLYSLPYPVQNMIIPEFTKFVDKTKVVFSDSLTPVFLIASIFMAVGFVVSFFLKEIPLRKTHDHGAVEAGEEIAIEEGTLAPSEEPILFS